VRAKPSDSNHQVNANNPSAVPRWWITATEILRKNPINKFINFNHASLDAYSNIKLMLRGEVFSFHQFMDELQIKPNNEGEDPWLIIDKITKIYS
jgi:hypothetical protein